MPQKMSFYIFKQKAKEKHNGFYLYTNSEKYYINSITKILIECPIHGPFMQRPSEHLAGHGCTKCKTDKLIQILSIPLSEMIARFEKLYPNECDYSLIEPNNYKGIKTKIPIICKKHNLLYYQTVNNHLYWKGCQKCAGHEKYTLKSFKEKASKIHNNKYNYDKIKMIIKSSDEVNIICPIHGQFKQRANSHLKGHGCKKCANIIIKTKQLKSSEQLIKEFNLVHDNFYTYSEIVYNGAHSKIKIICPIHGPFKQTPNHHLKGHGCSKCNASKGEIKINKYLKENNILFERQKRFKDCIYKLPLYFDFYLPQHNTCIEYDGEFHFKPKFIGKKAFLENKKRDLIKNKYCKEKGIKLIRIPYWEFDNVEKILSNYILSPVGTLSV